MISDFYFLFPSCNEKINMTPFFNVNSQQISSPTHLSSLSASQLGKVVTKPECSFLWCQWKAQTTHTPACGRTLTQFSPPNHHKTQAILLSWSLRLFQTCLRSLSCCPYRKPNYMNVKPFHTLLVPVWPHEFQYPHSILCDHIMSHIVYKWKSVPEGCRPIEHILNMGEKKRKWSLKKSKRANPT